MEVHNESVGASHEHRLLPRVEIRQRCHGRGGVQEDHGCQGVKVSISHVRDANPGDLSRADLYVFSSPGRMGKPKGNAWRFLRKVSLAPGTSYAILTTQGAPRPGKMPTEEELNRWERVIPIMNELLAAKGLTKVTEGAVLVTGIKGPLEEGWRSKVEAFADQIMSSLRVQTG
jgi:hypothetical protein